MRNTTALRQLLQQSIITAPGVFDGLSAKLANHAGFDAVYASGGAIARSSGYPDLGLISFTEMLLRINDIVDASKAPVIADADTGFGNEVNIQRTINSYEKIGVAAMHIEDQQFPKRCGHLDNKSLISKEDMCLKIKAAKKAQTDPDFILIARTDAIAVESLDAAIDRANAYHDAGADMLFIEAPQTKAQIETISEKIKAPQLINMFYGGKTPLIETSHLKALGFQLIIIPSDLQRAAIRAMQTTLNVIKEHGNSETISSQLASFKEREAIIETSRYLDLGE